MVSDVESLDMQEQSGLDGQLPGFPGYLLREAREKMGVSQIDTARELHLTSKVINAIEEDNFELIPSFVFARGYIRSYARHVGLDGQALVAEFDLVYGVPDHGTKPMSGIRKVSQQTKPSDAWVKIISILFVIGLVAVSIFWWQSQNDDSALSQINSVTVDTANGEVVENLDDADASLDLTLLSASSSEVGATVPADEVAVAVAAEPSVQPEDLVVVVAEPEPEVKVEEVQAPSEPTADAVVLAADQAQLVMVFEKDCWVEIKDGNGKMILSDLFAAGDKIERTVTAPIEVLLGRSSGVSEFTFDGRSIDLKPHTRKDIARLTLSK